MRKRNTARLILFAAVAAAHGVLIFFVAFHMDPALKTPEPIARVMKLVDVEEDIPPPPPPERPPVILQNTLEAIAETMVETDEIPLDLVIAEPAARAAPAPAASAEPDYLPMQKVSALPKMPDEIIKKATVYPPIARRSNIEGVVFLELLVDRQGRIHRITVLKEDPQGRGFGEAAVNAFKGIIAESPAMANGEAVAVRYRYPMRFTLK